MQSASAPVLVNIVPNAAVIQSAYVCMLSNLAIAHVASDEIDKTLLDGT